ncbi:MAG: hypothetical protein P857_900 [Candidatus Xenolissoclinum pacificiensis L6]|uniref:Flagellar hook-basal body complex protein FliE n=1 Tax=Candidatus Xenolissoclinum pacificiensis L6 TaxID=1401685 RepID=W2V2S9_9RICK|nr:MAG: hypothetical protein P857_900 [Candidatus Xenolissoclinum pacificiensis L6]
MMDISKINSLNNAFFVIGKNLNNNNNIGKGFETVATLLHETNRKLKASEDQIIKSMTDDTSLQEMTTSLNLAEMNLRLLVAVRDSFVSMWQEIMKMQL